MKKFELNLLLGKLTETQNLQTYDKQSTA